METRKEAIQALIEATYLGPEQLESLLQTFQAKATALGKKVKTGEQLEKAISKLKSKEFVTPFISVFDELSVEEIKTLTNYYNSEPKKKYSKAVKYLGSFFHAMENTFLE
jgi:hypothetical protein